MKTNPRGLGKGLDILLQAKDVTPQNQSEVTSISLNLIHANPDQPRKVFSDKALEELCESIQAQGVLQPILLRPHKEINGGYEIVAGERRWRAANMAGFKKIPALIKNVSDEQALAIALIENLQRESLDPIEQALALQTLKEKFNIKQEQLAKKVGKSRPAVANLLRLLNLPEIIQNDIRESKLSPGHARALVSLPSSELQLQARNEIINNNLNVRQAEKMIALLKKKNKPEQDELKIKQQQFCSHLQQQLSARIPFKISIKGSEAKGQVALHYSSQEELDKIKLMLEQ